MRLLALIAALAMLISISKTSRNEKEIFLEFAGGRSQYFLYLFVLWLYLIPVVLILLMPSVRVSAAGILFIPGIVVSRKVRLKLETCGTARADRLQDAVDKSVWLGFTGVAYVVLIDVLAIVFSTVFK